MNPTEQFRHEVESALRSLSIHTDQGTHYPLLDDQAEALASIQASTVLLLEGLKRYSFEHERSHKQVIEVLAIDQLIKDLSK